MRGHGGRGPSVSKVQDLKGTLRQILAYARKYYVLIFIAILLVFAQGFLQLQVTSKVSELVGLIARYNASGFKQGILDDIQYVAVFVIGFAVSMSIAMYTKNLIMSFAGNRVVRNARKDAFEKLQNLPVSYFDKNPAGRIVSSLTNDFDAMGNAITEGFVNALTSIVLIGVNLYGLLVKTPIKLSFVTLIAVPLIFIIFGRVTKSVFKNFAIAQKSVAEVNATVEESIYGLQAIKLYNQEEDSIAKFNVSNEELKESSYKASMMTMILGPLVTVFINMVYAVLIIVGVNYMLKDSHFSIALVSAAVMYSTNLLNPIREVGQLISGISAGIAGAERAFRILKEKSDYENDGNVEVKHIKGDIKFTNVNFSYVQDKPVLKDISFEVSAGEKIAIVGPTGSGKTTIINLLTKFYDIDSGEILIDGANIDSFKKKSLRSKVGVVLQDNYLFAGTVLDNIRYGKLDASMDEVVEAAKKANADGFISRLPKGYESEVASGGENFSLGERQLISIARTLLSNPDLLILDEATSSVDTRTERHIVEAMEKLTESRTSFVIAHRLQTIRDASRIIVIKEGQMIEFGSHDELISSRGFYYDLYTTQFRDAQ